MNFGDESYSEFLLQLVKSDDSLIVNLIDGEIERFKRTPKSVFAGMQDSSESEILGDSSKALPPVEMTANPFREILIQAFKTRDNNMGIVMNTLLDRLLMLIPKNDLLRDLFCAIPVQNTILNQHTVMHNSIMDLYLFELLTVSSLYQFKPYSEVLRFAHRREDTEPKVHRIHDQQTS